MIIRIKHIISIIIIFHSILGNAHAASNLDIILPKNWAHS